jgi:protein SCO1/2
MRACRLLAAVLIVAAAAAFAKTYPVDGIVLALDPAAQTMLVSHRPIGRYMPAMVMPFHVEQPGDLAPLYPGARVQFDLVIMRHGSLARNLRKATGPDAPIAAPKERLHVGDALPEFRLTDQFGSTVELADLRGKVVAIDFIYTRCPLPDVCPRLSANFATLQRRFHSDVMLLSVTVDPDYDTPVVLAGYAKRWTADRVNNAAVWRFLTGEIGPLAAALGEVYWSDEGSIGHNSTTSIVDRHGRLAATVEGSQYRIDQLEHLIARELEKPQ